MPERSNAGWSLATRLIHEGERAQPPAGRPTATPIYTTATYVYGSAEALDAAFAGGEDYVYARYGNPTVGALERVLAAAEQGIGAVAFSSGMAALHAALLAAGTPRGSTHPRIRGILAARDLYGATTNLLAEFFAQQGTPVAYCDMCDLAAVDAAIAETNPDVLLVEQISNPLLKVADVAELARRAKAAGARLIVDNTMATPIVQRPLALGADLVVHSATKYLGGHADATGGVVVARASLVRDTLRRYSKLLGSVLGPFEAQLILRGVKTLALRVRQQCASAAAVATWLADQPEVARVYYPGLPSHPQHDLAARAFDGLFGAMVSFDLRDPDAGQRAADRAAMFRFVDSLRLILPATSLGDIYTLITLPLISSHRDLTPEQRAERGIGDGMARLSIGIEDANDIIADLRGALVALQ
ncbi:trans-sulfuration enzyme family protein [Kouleothrix sp.]|uniref:trans-sulfuration enzyme family protein n=1 Tax=Kouleothrix sp. TaxID=2779161 RepID=UPI00391A6887